MATATKAKKETNAFNFFNVWDSNAKVLERIEEQSLQVLDKQKEWIDTANNQVTELEAYSKKVTTNWKNNVLEEATKNPKVFGEANFTEWVNKLEEISHISQNIAFSPAKASLDIFAKSHANFESFFVNALDQQQKNRSAFFKPFENASEQVKQAQENFLKSFDLPAK